MDTAKRKIRGAKFSLSKYNKIGQQKSVEVIMHLYAFDKIEIKKCLNTWE